MRSATAPHPPHHTGPPMAGTLSAVELAQRTGATYRQIDYWTRRGLLGPVQGSGRGSGHYRRFPMSAVLVADALVAVGALTEVRRQMDLYDAVAVAALAGETSATIGRVTISWGPK